MVASGIAERIRFPLPLVTGVAATLLALVGIWQATYSGPPAGLLLWLFASPVLAVVAAAALVAAVRRQWHARWIVVTIVSIVATVTLSAAIWMFALPDERMLPLALFWGVGTGYLVLAGVAASVAMAPVLCRQFSPVAGHLLGFACGLAGAAGATALVVTGLGLVVAGLAIVIVTLHRWRNARSGLVAHTGLATL